MSQVKTSGQGTEPVPEDVRHPGARGLCTTCVHSPSCSYLDKAGAAVWFCEEFGDGGFSGEHIGKPQYGFVESDRRDVGSIQETEGTYAGLCVNCAHRVECKYLQFAQKVLYCEDYM